MASPISSLTSSAASAATGSATASSLGGMAPNQEMFLQLLVAQIKNQDPLNPTDSVQFVSQLAQFSELEQVIAIRNDLDTAVSAGSVKTGASAISPTQGD
jgi:flagellar basal-body rod modification protein FlgD